MSLPPPRYENRNAFPIAGLTKHYSAQTAKDIPAQWRQLSPYFDRIPGQVGRTAYGVVFNTANTTGEFDYLSGVEVSESAGIPDEFKRMRIPDLSYAVFSHLAHVSKLKTTIDAIWREWLPSSGGVFVAGPDVPGLLERYGENFNPETGMGDIELWVPLKA